MYRCANCDLESETSFRFCPTCGVQQVAEADPGGLIGQTINGKYRILEELGSGSMGTVYLAEHASLRKRVAIKVLHRDLHVSEETLQRFQREGIAAGQFNHPNAIQIFDFDRDGHGHIFLAMEYVEGQSLKELLAAQGALSSNEAVLLAQQLLSTLVEAHRHGIVHRDLKPENLMVTRNASGEVNLKVLDFGLSKLVDRPIEASLQTKTGRVMGTPMYMAPEQWNGEEVDQRTDLYATALILYEMLVGQQPFRGNNLTETFVKSTTQQAPPLNDSRPDMVFPVALEELLQRGLAKARESRFQTAREMLDTLEHVDFDQAGPAGPHRQRISAVVPPAPRSRSVGPRSPVLWLGGAAVVVTILGLVIFGGVLDASGTGPLVSLMPEAERSEVQRNYVSLVEASRADLRVGNDANALVSINNAIQMPCADAEAYLVRATVYRARGDVDTALADLRDAMERYPDYAEACAEIGWIHFELGSLDEADRRFRAAVNLDGDQAAAQAGIGAVLSAREDHEEALRVLDAAAVDHPGSALVHAYRGKTQLALNMPDDAVQSLVDAKRLDSGLGWVYADLADAYLLKGEPRSAEQQLRAAMSTPGAADEVRSRLAALLLGKESYDEAAEVLRPVLTTSDSGDVQVMWGMIELGRGRREEAISALQDGLDRGASEVGRVHELLGALMLEEERWAEAARHCLAASRDGHVNARLFGNWGVARFHLGQYEAAADTLLTALEMDSADLSSRYTLGVLYMDYLMRPDLAVQQFKAYRDGGGDDPKVPEWIRRLGG